MAMDNRAEEPRSGQTPGSGMRGGSRTLGRLGSWFGSAVRLLGRGDTQRGNGVRASKGRWVVGLLALAAMLGAALGAYGLMGDRELPGGLVGNRGLPGVAGGEARLEETVTPPPVTAQALTAPARPTPQDPAAAPRPAQALVQEAPVQREDGTAEQERVQETAAFARPVTGGTVLRGPGWHRHPVYGEWRFQPGAELDVPAGTPVRAARRGVVRFVGAEERWGLSVRIQHDDGWETMYGLLREASVQEGQRVRPGEVIGASGVDRWGEPRLYLGVWRHGVPQDPATLLSL